MKKCLLAMMFAGLLAAGTALAAPGEVCRTIPYPAGLDRNEESPATAPAEIDHPDSEYFAMPDFFTMGNTKTRNMLTGYPTYQQTTEYTCGPAAALTVLYWYGNHDYDELSLAKAMKTQGYPIGTNPGNMVRFFQDIGWDVKSSLDGPEFATYDDFAAFALRNLRQGTPIMVENVDWGGHWRVIIGYDSMGTATTLDDVLIFTNSYDTYDHKQDGYTVENGEHFFYMWFDHSMLPKKERQQPWIVAHPPVPPEGKILQINH